MNEFGGLKSILDEAVKSGEVEKIQEALGNIEKCAGDVKLEDLQKTKIGVSVGKLRNHPNSSISSLANAIILRWKPLAPPKSTTPSSNSSSSQQNDEIKRKTSSSSSSSQQQQNNKTEDDEIEEPPKRKKTPSNISPTIPSPSQANEEDLSTTPNSQQSGSFIFEDTRTKSRAMLEEALNPPADNDKWKVSEAAEIIEEELYSIHGNKTDKSYKAQWRVIYLNLKNGNSRELRDSLMCNPQSPARICRMSSQDMAPEAVKKDRERAKAFFLREAKGTRLEDLAQSDMFECGKCHLRKTTFYEMQTRGADEPMTVFITCLNCKHRWRI